MKLHGLLVSTLPGMTTISAHAADWSTPAEAAHFRTTPSYSPWYSAQHMGVYSVVTLDAAAWKQVLQ